jgi:hypothetical protein
MKSCRLAAVTALTTVLAACASGGGAKTDAPTPVTAPPADAAPAPTADGLPMGFATAFTAADARARSIVYYQQCLATVLRLRASGTFGKAASAPRAVYCERTADGVPIGGVFDIDSAFTSARRLTMIRLDGQRPRYAGAVDTVRVAVEAKLLRDINRDVATGWKMLARPYVLAPVAQSDGTIEGWVIPLATKARSVITGGDIGMTRASNGGLSRVADHLGTWKQVPLPATGPVKLMSAEREVPAVMDLVTARGLADGGREVAVMTAAVRSALVPGVDAATGSRFTWQHARATP